LHFPRTGTILACGASQSWGEFAFYSGCITAPKDISKAVKNRSMPGLHPTLRVAANFVPAEIFGVGDRLGSIENG